MIGLYKHIPLIGINDIDALVSQEKLLFLPFFKLKFIFQLGEARIHIIIAIHFMIGHHKHILLIRVNDIDDLVLEEKLLFVPVIETNFIFQ